MRQLHAHRAACKKGNQPTCRFGMPDFIMSKTMVLRPLYLEGEEAKRALEILKEIHTVVNAKEMRRKEQARSRCPFLTMSGRVRKMSSLLSSSLDTLVLVDGTVLAGREVLGLEGPGASPRISPCCIGEPGMAPLVSAGMSSSIVTGWEGTEDNLAGAAWKISLSPGSALRTSWETVCGESLRTCWRGDQRRIVPASYWLFTPKDTDSSAKRSRRSLD